VRPISTRRAISDLLTPARCSLRISAAWTAAVAGRPSRFPFCRAWARPARVRSRRISRSNSAKREAREKLLEAARRREIDIVLVWRLDRWGRSVTDLLATLQELEHLGVGFISLTEALDLTTPVIVQPRRAAYSRIARFCIASVC